MDAAETRPQGIKATTENRGGWRNVSCSSSIPPPPPPLPPASPPNQLLQTSVLTTILSVFLSSLAGGGLLLQLRLPIFILPFFSFFPLSLSLIPSYLSFLFNNIYMFYNPPSISHLLLLSFFFTSVSTSSFIFV